MLWSCVTGGGRKIKTKETQGEDVIALLYGIEF